jgi:hypothetical protein
LCPVSYLSIIARAPIMLHIRQKRASKGVTFTKPQASSSKSSSTPTTVQPSKSAPKSARVRHVRNASSATSTRASQQPPKAPAKVSNRQRRLASLFMALMASSPLPIEADTETLEAAQKDSIAPKAPPHKRRVSTIRVQEVRTGRWKRFRYELSLKTRRKGKTRWYEGVELDDLVKFRGADRSKGDDMA